MSSSARNLERISTLSLSNPSGPGDESRRFTRKELEEACRKVSLFREASRAAKTQRSKPLNFRTLLRAEAADAVSQVRALDFELKMFARKYNESKAQADKLEEELNRKLDEHAELEKESLALDEMIRGDNPSSQKITRNTAEIERVNTVSESKLRYRLQLNHMHLRQRKNSIAMDAYLGAMSLTLNSVEKEKQICEKMLGEVESVLTQAMQELDLFTRGMEVDRLDQRRALKAKRIEASNAEKLEEWRIQSESNRMDIVKESLGGTFKADKEMRIEGIKEREEGLKKLNSAFGKKTNTPGSSEASFAHIKRATGANSLLEMVDKFTHHQERYSQLVADKREAQDRLQTAKISLGSALENSEQMKSNGFGDTEVNRELVDELSEQISEETTKCKVMKSTNKRLESLLAGLRENGVGLYLRLIPYHPTLIGGEAPNLIANYGEFNTEDKTDDDEEDSDESFSANGVKNVADATLKMLKVTEELLEKMIATVGGLEKIRAAESKDGADASIDIHSDCPNLGGKNCRIQAKDDSQISLKAESDSESECSSNDSCSDETTATESPAFSRISLKAYSEHQADAAKKTKELERKKRLSKERARSARGSSHIGSQNAAEARREQAESMDRMAKHVMPVGLPKSVNLRDDPSTKAQAFLTEMPWAE